jgi:hypothetical protein
MLVYVHMYVCVYSNECDWQITAVHFNMSVYNDEFIRSKKKVLKKDHFKEPR